MWLLKEKIIMKRNYYKKTNCNDDSDFKKMNFSCAIWFNSLQTLFFIKINLARQKGHGYGY